MKHIELDINVECSALYSLSQSLGWKGAIPAVQLNSFIPAAFPEKAKYIQMVLHDNIDP